MDLHKKYAKYTVLQGTKLYRRANTDVVLDEMFFAFAVCDTYNSYHRSSNLQIWEVTSPITALCIIKGKTPGGKFLSAIIDIYNIFFPKDIQDEKTYVELKKYGSHRQNLIGELKKQGITAWVCSIDNNVRMELFVFHSHDENAKLLKHIETIALVPQSLSDDDSFDYKTLPTMKVINKNSTQFPFFV